MMRKIFFLSLALVLGCSRQLSSGQIQEIERDCEILASSVRVPQKAQVDLSTKSLPISLSALHPKAVYINEEGIYIKIGSFFVEEWEFFYLRPNAVFSAATKSDPGYELMGKRLYRYRIKG